MATQYTELELAIHTLVSQFHEAAPDNGPTLKVEEFKTLLSTELPNMVKITDDEEGFTKVLEVMEVAEGQSDVSFTDFWKLVDYVATNQHGLLSKEKKIKCTCLLL